MLQDALGGNAKTVMVANMGPADYNFDGTTCYLATCCLLAAQGQRGSNLLLNCKLAESMSTLRYANRAKVRSCFLLLAAC